MRMSSNEKVPVSERKAHRIAMGGKGSFMLDDLVGERLKAAARVEAEAEGTEAHDVAAIRENIAAKRVDLFYWEHDSTGALKGDRFGRDLSKDMRGRAWERDAEGKLLKGPEDERAHVLLVNMGDLDRLNAVSDHSLGDAGLRRSAECIEMSIREVLSGRPEFKDERRLADAYDIYRYSGNDFAVSLRGVDEDDADEIMRRVSMEPVEVPGGGDPVPLVASRASRSDGIGHLNALTETPEEAGLSTEMVLISTMLEQAQVVNDARKTEDRANRMAEKVLLVEEGKMSEDEARKLYDSFFKKSLGGAFRPAGTMDDIGFEGFRALVNEQRGSREVYLPTRWTHEASERSLDAACDALHERRVLGRSIDHALAAKIAETALSPVRIAERTVEFGSPSSSRRGEETVAQETSLDGTRGMMAIKAVGASRDAAEAKRGAGDREAAEADLAQVAYEIECAKRDMRTGLYQRGMYFRTMESAMKEGKPLATVAIDMAFLKYFDKEGGVGAGDLAIKKAVSVLASVAETFTKGVIAVEAHRLGGDEFALTVVGGDEKTVKDIRDAIKKTAEDAGSVPPQRGATEAYRPEPLQFNTGVRIMPDQETFRKELQAMDIPLKKTGTRGEQNELADYFVRMADKEVEIEKAVSRIALLVGQLNEVGNDPTHPNVKTLLKYSSKAIFGDEASVVRFAQRATAEAEGLSALMGEIHRFVKERIDERNLKNDDYETSLDRVLEDAVRIRYYESRIRELEDRIMGLEAENRKRGDSVEIYRRQAESARMERDTLLELRTAIAGSAAPPSTRPEAA